MNSFPSSLRLAGPLLHCEKLCPGEYHHLALQVEAEEDMCSAMRSCVLERHMVILKNFSKLYLVES